MPTEPSNVNAAVLMRVSSTSENLIDSFQAIFFIVIYFILPCLSDLFCKDTKSKLSIFTGRFGTHSRVIRLTMNCKSKRYFFCFLSFFWRQDLRYVLVDNSIKSENIAVFCLIESSRPKILQFIYYP